MIGRTPESIQARIDNLEKEKQELLALAESDCDFLTWRYEKASDEEKILADKMCGFEHLFPDMIFDEDSITYKYLKVFEGDDSKESSSLVPDELGCNFTYNWFRTEVKELKPGYMGSYIPTRWTICISPNHVGNDSVLLHEMIHLHEHVINELCGLPLFYHDLLCWALYQDLREKISDLDKAIGEYAHLLNGTQLYRNGGEHDILFLLKSFDLDMRMEYPFGTVFGYGKVNEFEHLTIITKSEGESSPT